MKKNNIGPSSRQLKVGENLRKAISLMIQNHSFHNPIIDRASILITEVKISPDLSNASVYISTLGGVNNSPELISALNKKLTKVHSSIADVTDQYQALFVSGSKTRTVLSKGCSIDLHPNEFLPNQCTQTLLSSVDIILHCTSKDSFSIFCRSSFAKFLIDWLKDAGLEYDFTFSSR